jgi:DNA-binding CsgD family transcriptional regulator
MHGNLCWNASRFFYLARELHDHVCRTTVPAPEPLTRTHGAIIRALCAGKSKRQIAEERRTVLGTVRNQVKQILQRTDLHSVDEVRRRYSGPASQMSGARVETARGAGPRPARSTGLLRPIAAFCVIRPPKLDCDESAPPLAMVQLDQSLVVSLWLPSQLSESSTLIEPNMTRDMPRVIFWRYAGRVTTRASSFGRRTRNRGHVRASHVHQRCVSRRGGAHTDAVARGHHLA